MIDTIIICLTCVAAVGVIAYCFLEWLRSYKRRNDLADKFQAYERAVEARILALETVHADHEHRLADVTKRTDNILANHEASVSRFGAFRDDIDQRFKDLVEKWIGEIQTINTRQVAAFEQSKTPTHAHIPRFRP